MSDPRTTPLLDALLLAKHNEAIAKRSEAEKVAQAALNDRYRTRDACVDDVLGKLAALPKDVQEELAHRIVRASATGSTTAPMPRPGTYVSKPELYPPQRF